MIILASASPQRKKLLEGLGIEFSVEPSGYDESLCEEQDPRERAVVLARAKAKTVYDQHRDQYVIGCDTLVVSESGTLLEKPADEKSARAMLSELSGRTCTVISALCVINPKGSVFEDVSSTEVTFTDIDSKIADWWIETKLWKDRSGGFQIDGLGQLMISDIRGDWTGVVGLPVFLLGGLLQEAGLSLLLLRDL